MIPLKKKETLFFFLFYSFFVATKSSVDNIYLQLLEKLPDKISVELPVKGFSNHPVRSYKHDLLRLSTTFHRTPDAWGCHVICTVLEHEEFGEKQEPFRSWSKEKTDGGPGTFPDENTVVGMGEYTKTGPEIGECSLHSLTC